MNAKEVNSSTQRMCTKCKQIKKLSHEFYSRDKNRRYGFMYKCKECEKRRKDNRKNRWSKLTDEQKGVRREYSKSVSQIASRMLSNYRRYDLAKGYTTTIDTEFIINSITQPCHYCGFSATGLDRVDSRVGHTKGNCVPCCKECNTAKLNHFTEDEMKIIGESISLVKGNRVFREYGICQH